MSQSEFTVRIAVTLCFLALLVIVSTVPGVDRPGNSLLIRAYVKTPRELQKFLHVCLYGVLTMMLIWAFAAVHPLALRYSLALAFAVCFGAAMQWWQTKVPGRFGTLADVALDASGATLAVVVAAFVSY